MATKRGPHTSMSYLRAQKRTMRSKQAQASSQCCLPHTIHSQTLQRHTQ
jgi:hypothetical protein